MLAIVDNRMVKVTDVVIGDDYCGICRRPTCHWGEHDDLVDLGQAQNVMTQSVYGDKLYRTYTVERTERFDTLEGAAERQVWSDALDRVITAWVSGRVSLVKPVAEARAYTRRQAAAA